MDVCDKACFDASNEFCLLILTGDDDRVSFSGEDGRLSLSCDVEAKISDEEVVG